MNKKIIPIILFCVLFLSAATSPVKARDDDYGERLMKALNITKKSGMEVFQQDREFGQLRMTISTMINISTALEIFSTDHSGKYPVSLNELSPHYIRNVPGGLSKAGNFPFVYRQKNGGKGYAFYCKGTNYAQFGIPADYPRCSNPVKRTGISEIYLKPGVLNPPYRKPTAESRARDEYIEIMSNLPELLQKKDPKQAKEVRLKMTKLIKSGKLRPDEVKMGNRLIETCLKIEQGKMK